MDVSTFAHALIAADPSARPAVLAAYPALGGPELAEALRGIYFASYSSAPAQAAAAAAGLAALAATCPDPGVAAVAHWVAGLAALQLEGRLEDAIAQIDTAAAGFLALGRTHSAAETQVGKVVALARLGRYTEALACGRAARAALLAHNDPLAAGRIELNLGNLCFQRDQYTEAEAYYQSAYTRFAAAADQRMLAFVANGLANVYSRQLRIDEATAHYEAALAAAIADGQTVTQAEIECNLGSLALFQGQYDRALALLEGSRKHYAALDLPHESAVAELELGDAYLELGLLDEAATIYRPLCTTFATMGMPAEQARALLNYSRACVHLGRLDTAQALLDEAAAGFRAAGNAVGLALATLLTAWIAYRNGDYAAVAARAAAAEAPLRAADAWEPLLSVYWLRGMAAAALGDVAAAQTILAATLAEAQAHGAAPIAQRCLTALGQLARRAGDLPAAEAALRQAVTIGEALRDPLPADALRIALATETLTPYNELAWICLADPAHRRLEEAFQYAERGRARALTELLSAAVALPGATHSVADAADLAHLRSLRAELNWLYTRLSRTAFTDEPPTAPALLAAAAREREAALSALHLRLQLNGVGPAPVQPLDVATLQTALGTTTALVEYLELDGRLAAFVLTEAGVHAVRDLGPLTAVRQNLERLRFQIGALSQGAAAMRGHLDTLTERTRHHLAQLAAQLVTPLAPFIGTRRLAVAPCGALHAVPFHALVTPQGYLIEQREVCVVPSAAVLHQCLSRPRRPLARAVLLGVADAQTPHVEAEALALAATVPGPTTLIGAAATQAALRAAAPAADLLHLACHARFRPDRPLFSALQLADGPLTVYDAWSLGLQRCQLVTLSACETGLNMIAAGEELQGLARGFFAAGAPAILGSMWPVDDAATMALMHDLYRRLAAGAAPAAALRAAQCAALARDPHPFFWASFTLLGRW